MPRWTIASVRVSIELVASSRIMTGRVGHGRARDGEQLALALREVRAVAVEHRVVALGQPADEVVRAGQLGRVDARVVVRVQIAVADVLHDRSGEQVRVLKDDAQTVPQVGLLDLVDVDAVVADLAVGDVVEAVDQVRDRRLARAGGADERQLLAGLGVQRDVVQHGLFRRIAEVHVEEPHVAHQLGIGGGAVVVRVLPRPDLRALLALGQAAVRGFLGVDERDVAFVRFGLLVQQREDAVRAREAHDDHVHLIGDLADGAGELLGHVQKRHHDADAERHAGEADVRHVRQQQHAI